MGKGQGPWLCPTATSTSFAPAWALPQCPPPVGELPEDRDKMLAQDSCPISEDLWALHSALPSSHASLATEAQELPQPHSQEVAEQD